MLEYQVPLNEKPIYEIHADCESVEVFQGGIKVKECQLPAKLTVKTKDCWDGNLTEETNDPEKIRQLLAKPMNPCTGPICFKDVQPGDVLEIKIDNIECEPGSVMTIDFEGVSKDIVEEVVTRLYSYGKDHILALDEDCKVQLNPMIGVIGVLPAAGTYPTCATGDWGGNMDTTLIKKGATLYLPVQLAGGLLYMGDAHAQMGEGEQYTTGLEADATYTLTIDVKKDMKIDIPFVKADGRLASIYSAPDNDTDAALRGALKKFITFLVDNAKKRPIEYNDAGILCGLFGDLAISQIADDPYRTARLSMKLDILKQYLGIEV